MLTAIPSVLIGLLTSAVPLSLRAWVAGDEVRLGSGSPQTVLARVDQRVELGVREALPTSSELRWYQLVPIKPAVDNTRPRFHFEQLDYERRELIACRGERRCRVTVEPAGRPSPVRGTGTMAFQVEATLPDGEVRSSPGTEARHLGGLDPRVLRVVVRRDDSYLGYLTELFQTPYIFGSSGVRGDHQTDLRIGSDCADLVIYGARRLGKPLKYTSTWTIDEQLPELTRATRTDREGRTVSESGHPLRIAPDAVRPGDALLFPGTRHVAVLYEDVAPLGVLDAGDLILHTCWDWPTIEPLSATGCASYPIRVLRLPD